MSAINPKIEASWKAILRDEFNKNYFNELKQFLRQEKQQHIIYPIGKEIFNAFNCTPFEKVKVVILGQDPYHGKGQAHGLSFSVPFGIKPPPSLKNIFNELKADLDIPIAESGNLTSWAKQGVLLLNATLTVRAKQAGSHQNKGWENFTDAVISSLSENKEDLVFLLWGRFAQNKASLIDSKKHYILTAAHPSPFSAYGGFFGCKHFSKTNEILNKNGLETIDWRLQ